MVGWIFEALPGIFTLGALAAFIFIVFGVVGMDLFEGTLHYRCALPGFAEAMLALRNGHSNGSSGSSGEPQHGHRELTETAPSPARNGGHHIGPQAPWDTGLLCNPSLALSCAAAPSNSSCSYFDQNPPGDFASFDSIFPAFLILFQQLTGDTWHHAMYEVMLAYSPFASIYFLFAINVNLIIIANLFVAIIFVEVEASSHDTHAKQKSDVQRLNLLDDEFGEGGGGDGGGGDGGGGNGGGGNGGGGNGGGGGGDSAHGGSEADGSEAGGSEAGGSACSGSAYGYAPGAFEAGGAVPGASEADGAVPGASEAGGAVPGASEAGGAVPGASEAGGSGRAASAAEGVGSAVQTPSPPPSPTAIEFHTADEADKDEKHTPGQGGAAPPGPHPPDIKVEGASSARLGRCLERVATSKTLYRLAMSVVLIDLVLECMAYDDMSEEFANDLETGSNVINWIFLTEMSLKLLGLGCRGYWCDRWNVLDGVITLESMATMEVKEFFFRGAASSVSLSYLRVLRLLRLIRILRLLHDWQTFYMTFTTFVRVIPQLRNLTILILSFTFVFALLGMQFFGGLWTTERGYEEGHISWYEDGHVECVERVCPSGLLEKPEYHFDHWYMAMITIFMLSTGKWVHAMEPIAEAVGLGCGFFFVGVVVLGKYMLLNFLISVIIVEFSITSTEQAIKKAKKLREERRARREARKALAAQAAAARAATEVERRALAAQGSAAQGSAAASRPWRRVQLASAATEAEQLHIAVKPVTMELSTTAVKPWPHDFSLLCFPPAHPFRRFCRSLIAKPAFDRTVNALILVSSICLALDSPLNDPTSALTLNLQIFNIVVAILFFLEMMIKAVALGFVSGNMSIWNPRDFFSSGKESYLHSPWNILDFVITIILMIIVIDEVTPGSTPALRALRILMVFRPLRLIRRHAGMKRIINSLAKVMPAILEIFGIFLALHLVFAVCGMDLFMGKLAYCSDPSILTKAECLGGDGDHSQNSSHSQEVPRRLLTAQTPDGAGIFHSGDSARPFRQWTNDMASFDDFGRAMLMLYVTSSGDHWGDQMFSIMGVVGRGHAPMRDDFSPNALFMIAWIFFGFIFVRNLFVGVIAESFARQHREDNHVATMTPEQDQWVKTVRAVMNAAPQKGVALGKHPVRRAVSLLVTSPHFDNFILLTVVVNVLLMTFDDSEDVIFANKIFASFYCVESVLKIIGFGPRFYFTDPWCRFDFFLLCTSLFLLFPLHVLLDPMIMRIFRILRILLIVRVPRKFRRFRDLVLTVVYMLPSILNIGMLISILMYVYAILGRQLFARLAGPEAGGGANGGITNERNFQTLGSSLLIVSQVLTEDGWSKVMADCLLNDDERFSGMCSYEVGDCGSVVAVPYFISCHLFGSLVLLNILIASILETYSALHRLKQNLLSPIDVEVFTRVWASCDPTASGFILAAELPELLERLRVPLAIPKRSTDGQRPTLSLQIPQYEAFVAYQDVLVWILEHNYFRANAGSIDEADLRSIVDSSQLHHASNKVPLSASDKERTKRTKRMRRRQMVSGCGNAFNVAVSIHDQVGTELAPAPVSLVAGQAPPRSAGEGKVVAPSRESVITHTSGTSLTEVAWHEVL
jgi:hypothetical protein